MIGTMSTRELWSHTGYMRLWWARLAGVGASQMMLVAIGWQMYDLSGSAWDLGLGDSAGGGQQGQGQGAQAGVQQHGAGQGHQASSRNDNANYSHLIRPRSSPRTRWRQAFVRSRAAAPCHART